MKGLIVYYSRYGSTRSYAQLLAEKSGWQLRSMDTVTKKELIDTDVLLIASMIRIGRMPIRRWARRHASLLKKKQLVVLAVGGTSPTNQKYYIQSILKNLAFLDLLPEQCFGLGGREIGAVMKGMDACIFKILEKIPTSPKEHEEILKDIDYFDPAGIEKILLYMQKKAKKV